MRTQNKKNLGPARRLFRMSGLTRVVIGFMLVLTAGEPARTAGQTDANNILPPPADEGYGLLFHASFDTNARADFAVGSPLPSITDEASLNLSETVGKRIPGVFGQAQVNIAGPYGRRSYYDALGNFLPERGTVAFHVRQKGMVYGFESFYIFVSPYYTYYWNMYLRFPGGNSVWFPNEVYQPIVLGPKQPVKLEEDKWHHRAVTWDQAYGAKLYFDGKEIASNYGQVSWTSRGVNPDFFYLHHADTVAYDELYVFDRPLTAEQVAALASRNIAPGRGELPPVPFNEERRINRLRELSWRRPDPGMLKARLGAEGLGANALRQVFPLAARIVKREGGDVIDGELGSGFPTITSYDYAGGNGVHIEMGEPYDYLLTEGYFHGDVYGENRLLPEGAQPFHQVQSAEFMNRWKLAEPRPAGWLSFFKTKMEDKGELPDKELVTTSRICEIGFFRTDTNSLADASPIRYYLGPADITAGAAVFGTEFIGRFGPGDRAVLSVSQSQPGTSGGQAVPALRYHHIILPPAPYDTPLRGIRLGLWLGRELEGNAVRVEVRDAIIPARRIFMADFALTEAKGKGPQPLDLTLDISDRIIPRGKSVWLTICFKNDADILWTGPGRNSFVDFLTGPQETSKDEYLRTELLFAKNRFSRLSEARPWGSCADPERELTDFNRDARELFLPLEFIRKLAPNHPKIKALWSWTHKRTENTMPIKPLPVGGCENAPRWALLERELLAKCRDVLYWWIDNRQVPNGEYGDGFGDDTDLSQNFDKLALLGDPGNRLRNAVKLTADGVYQAGLITNGLNAGMTDSLHAYEEGINIQPVIAMIDYGNPVYMERLMESARNVEERLTTIDSKGRRRFRSTWYGAKEVRDKGDYAIDSTGNALMCHPAIFLSYYGHQPRALKFLRDWLDGWLTFYAEHTEHMKPGTKRFPAQTHLDGRVMGWDTRLRGYGFDGVIGALSAITGEKKYTDLAQYWIENDSMSYLAYDGLDMFDREKLKGWIAKSAEVDLLHPFQDNIDFPAREHYLRFEILGDEKAAYDALEVCVRNIRLMFDGYTWAEPIDDRIWLPDRPLVVMMEGETPHARNEIWPKHYVSYRGLSDYAAWVREKSDTSLKIWIYSFAAKEEKGFVRVWRTPLGEYETRFGEDKNGDCEPDEAVSQTMTLHRAAFIPVTVPPRKLCALTVRMVKKSEEDFWKRADLAICEEDIRRAGEKFIVTVHNIGNQPVKNVLVRLVDDKGGTLAEQTVAEIEAPLDLIPRKANAVFEGVKAKPVRVIVDPENTVLELNRDNNSVEMPK